MIGSRTVTVAGELSPLSISARGHRLQPLAHGSVWVSGLGSIPVPTTLPTRLSTAAATHRLFRAYHPARRAAVVAPARIAAFSPTTARAPSQRRPPPAASKPRARARPKRRWRRVRIGWRIARNGPSSYCECLGCSAVVSDGYFEAVFRDRKSVISASAVSAIAFSLSSASDHSLNASSARSEICFSISGVSRGIENPFKSSTST